MSIPRSCIPVPKIEEDCYDWWKRHEFKKKQVLEHDYKLVFIGDSITHFWSAEDDIDYGAGDFLRRFDPEKVLNLGYGYDRTQNALWHIENGELAGLEPEMFVVNIGTNQFSVSPNYDGDTPEAACEGICCVVDTLKKRFPSCRIILMALFPRQKHSEKVAAVNALLREKELPVEVILDLTDRLGDENRMPIPEYYRPDGTHLIAAGYRIWGEALEPYVKKYMN